MKQCLVSLLYLIICQFHVNAQGLTLQYWFDDNFSAAMSGSVTGNVFQSNIPVNNLLPGSHIFHYRVQDSNAKWSAVNSREFRIAPKLTTYEFWIDDQYNAANSVTIAETTQFSIDSVLSLVNLSPGTHQIHYRFRNSAGAWSAIVTRPFAVEPKIDRYEYWFDQEYQAATQVTLPQTVDEYMLNTNLVNLPGAGLLHNVHVRFHHTDGRWGPVLSRAWQLPTQVTGIEYWYNYQYSTASFQAVTPSGNFQQPILLNVSNSPLGSNTILLRMKDANGKWSPVITAGYCHNQGDSLIHLNLLLEGFYAGMGSMQPVLLNQGVGNNTNLVDSIDVTLHATSSPFQSLATTRVPLFTDGSASCNFPWTYIGSYYLSIRHRNSIETWTSFPVTRGQCPLLYDFTDAASKAFGNNMLEIEPGHWAFYTGDISQDENIDLLDASYLEASINNFEFGYVTTDLNGDGNVDLLDSPVLESNINGFIFSAHP